MKTKLNIFYTSLASISGIALLAVVLIRALAPRIILPSIDVRAVVTCSLLALLVDAYAAKEHARCYIALPLIGAFVFGVLPLCALYVTWGQAALTALLGAVVLPLTTFLFDALCDRLSTSPAKRLAPPMVALGIFLAIQILVGIL